MKGNSKSVVALQKLVKRAQEAADERRWDDAAEQLEQACEITEREKLTDAWARWLYCVALDNTGRPEEALEQVERSLGSDPSSAGAIRSRGIVLNRLRERVVDLDLAVREREQAYASLASRGEADLPCHLAHARILLAAGKKADALRVVDAAGALWAGHPEVEALRGELAGPDAPAGKDARS